MVFNGNNDDDEVSRRLRREKRRRKNSFFSFRYFPISLIWIGFVFLLVVGPLVGLGREKEVLEISSKAGKAEIHQIEKKLDLSQDKDFRFSPIEAPIKDKEGYQPDYGFSEEPPFPFKEEGEQSLGYWFSEEPVGEKTIKAEMIEIRKLIRKLEKLSSDESRIINKIQEKLSKLEKFF